MLNVKPLELEENDTTILRTVANYCWYIQSNMPENLNPQSDRG
jgi:hypothetical protein